VIMVTVRFALQVVCRIFICSAWVMTHIIFYVERNKFSVVILSLLDFSELKEKPS